MPRKFSRDPISSYARESTAKRRFGTSGQCECGENRPEALIPKSNPVICARCKRTKEGKSTTDLHHVAGRANSQIVEPVDVNDHRAVLSVAQEDWEKPIMSNPAGCPLIAAAGKIRGFADLQVYRLEQLILANPAMLVALSEYLEKKLGPNWWIGTQLEKYCPKR